MNPMDIASIASTARQAMLMNTKNIAMLRMTMDSAKIQAQGVAQMLPDTRQLSMLTGTGRYVDITL